MTRTFKSPSLQLLWATLVRWRMDNNWQTQESSLSSAVGSDIIAAERCELATSEICHPDPSFEDGNLALRSVGGHYFFVHKGVVSRHCSFFRNNLVCFDERNTDLVEGRPVVQLADSSDDLSYFLKALYDGMCVVAS